MSLLENPFNIVGATVRDNRKQIMDLVEERSLLADEEIGGEVVALLTNPKKRLSAELGWLPGVAPNKAKECIELIKSNPLNLLYRLTNKTEPDEKISISKELKDWLKSRKRALEYKRDAESKGEIVSVHRSLYDSNTLESKLKLELDVYVAKKEALNSSYELPPISKANLYAAVLGNALKNFEDNEITKTVLDFANSYDAIDHESTLKIINEEREVSGFPRIEDPSLVEAELYERRQHYKKTIVDALDTFPAQKLVKVVTDLVENVTNGGETHAPILIDDVIDTYEVHAQSFFQQETKNINNIVKKIRNTVEKKATEEQILTLIQGLEKVVKNWDLVAQPIQVSSRSRGLDHDLSHQVAQEIRSLAIDLFNNHDFAYASKRLTELNQSVFAEVDKVVDQTIEDSSAIDEIMQDREKYVREAQENKERWGIEITFEHEWGIIPKRRIKISPEGVEWKGRKIELESINKVRWGGTRHSINGIPSGTTYNIYIGSNNSNINIELKQSWVYEKFIEKLWKAVGVRLLTDLLADLSEGKSVKIGEVNVDDFGIWLERKHFLKENDKVHCNWGELSIGNVAGGFAIVKRDEKKVSASLSHQEDNNVHVLEAAMRAYWKGASSDRLSGLLQK